MMGALPLPDAPPGLFDPPPQPYAQTASAPPSPGESPSYKVLARKYRPRRFDQMIGQEALVKILSQGLAKDRLGHGFLFSGIRGVGKTTTARVLAAILNCSQRVQEKNHLEPCGTCPSCLAFDSGKHLDILEIDAASHTGVDDIREILEACRYRPLLGPFKIFIIDEVHMLSKSAFNALLKTLEEPPAHVKFILATTEVRKIPPTVISRCLRFDLKRIPPDVLVAHLTHICAQEGVHAEPEALFAIARAGEGSARDSLSLLDQAIVLAHQELDPQAPPHIRLKDVRQMLGLLDQSSLQGLFDAILRGEGAQSVEQARALYTMGLDPSLLLEEIGHWVHQLSCLQAGVTGGLTGLTDEEEARLLRWKEQASLPVLGFLWQMLVKGSQEMQLSSFPQQALEMMLLRLAYATQIPLPFPPASSPTPYSSAPASTSQGAKETLKSKDERRETFGSSPAGQLYQGTQILPAPPPSSLSGSSPAALDLVDLPSVLAALAARREGMLHTHLMEDVVVHTFQPGRILLHLKPGAPGDLLKRLEDFLQKETGYAWTVRSQGETSETPEGRKTLAEQLREEAQDLRDAVEGHPLVERVRTLFPGAVLESVEVA